MEKCVITRRFEIKCVPYVIPYTRFLCVKELSHQNVKARANALLFHIIVFHLRLCEFARTQKCSKSSGCTGDYQVACTPKTVNLPVRGHSGVPLSAAGAVFLRNFIFSFNDRRSAVELTTDARRSDNLKRTPAASRTILFSDRRSVLSFKPPQSRYPCFVSRFLVCCPCKL